MRTDREPYPFERISPPEPKPPVLRPGRKRIRRFHFAGLRQLLPRMLAALNDRQALALLPVALIAARATVLGELSPFGFAFPAAFGFARRERLVPLTLAAGAGFCTARQGLTFPEGASLAALAVLLWKLPRKNRRARLLTAILSGLCVFFVQTLVGLTHGVQYFTEMVVILNALLVFFLCYVLLFFAEALRQKKPLSQYNFEEISSAVLTGGIFLLGISDWTLWGLNLCSVLCRSAILVTAYLWGSGGGTMMGVTAGVIPSLSTGLFAQSLSMFAAAGLVAGWFRRLGRLPVILAFFSGVTAISFYALPEALTLQSLSENALSALLFYFLADRIKNFLPPAAFPVPPDKDPAPPDISGLARQRIDRLAQVFEDIGESLSPEVSAPTDTGCLNYLHEHVTGQLCANCLRYDLCWKRYSQQTSDDLLHFFTLAGQGTALTAESLPPRLKARCIRHVELLELTRRLSDGLALHRYFTEKITDSRQLTRQQLKGAGALLRSMTRNVEPLLQTPPEPRKHPVFRVETGAAQRALQEVCGDCFSFLALPDGKLAALLSDGMGVGAAARQESETVMRLLQSMLSSGFSLEAVLKTINSVLLLRSTSDSFATLDLLTIDLMNGEASLVKTAAAPTFLKRRGRVRAIYSSALPVGILQELDVRQETLLLEDQDLILLLTDGMMDPFRFQDDTARMAELLSGSDTCSCQYLADTLLARSAPGATDDSTVLCLRLIRL